MTDKKTTNLLIVSGLALVLFMFAFSGGGNPDVGEDPIYCEEFYLTCLSFMGLYIEPPIDHIEGNGVSSEFCQDHFQFSDCVIMSIANHSPDSQELSWSYQTSQSATYCHPLAGMPEDVDYLYFVNERICMKSTNEQTGWFNNGVFEQISPEYEYNIQRNTVMMAIDCSGLSNEQCITKHDNVMSTEPPDREWGNELFFVATIGLFGLFLVNRKQLGV